jgi:hypothetical protein
VRGCKQGGQARGVAVGSSATVPHQASIHQPYGEVLEGLMKFTINVDCTPVEAREFIGLPDVAPMQERLLKEMEERMRDRIKNLDPEVLIRTWIPATIQNLGELQKVFWSQMGMAQPGASKDEG